MKAEIIAVGTELLLGEVINSNAAWISAKLADLGVDVYYHSVVGDNVPRIHQLLQQACERSDLILFTGGLGPTDDDLTVSAIAHYFETPLIEDPHSLERIQAFFLTRDMPMSKRNVKQALRPEKALALDNPVGTAPGLYWEVSDHPKTPNKSIIMACFPGVPKELYAMWDTFEALLKQHWQQAGFTPQVLYHQSLNFFGIGESLLSEKLGDLMAEGEVTVAPYVGRASVRIRLATKAVDQSAAMAKMAPVKAEILKRCGAYYFGDDGVSLESLVADQLKTRNLKLALAESCTGGLVSSRLTDVPGSSAYTHLNVVTYANAEKTRMLGVPADMLDTYGAVSEPVAQAMALGVQQLTGSDIGMSLTGIAGPEGGTPEKPVGLVYIGLCGGGRNAPEVHRVMVNPKNSREDIKYWFSQYALYWLYRFLEAG